MVAVKVMGAVHKPQGCGAQVRPVESPYLPKESQYRSEGPKDSHNPLGRGDVGHPYKDPATDSGQITFLNNNNDKYFSE